MSELATFVISGGLLLPQLSAEQLLVFQGDLLLAQLSVEDLYLHLAASSQQQTLVVCDRGAIDGKGFVSKEQWEAILQKNSLTEVTVHSAALHCTTHCTLHNTLHCAAIHDTTH